LRATTFVEANMCCDRSGLTSQMIASVPRA
jgi:hypothetical protein